MSWMTPAAFSTGCTGHLLVGEELGDPVAALVEPVQRKVQLGDDAEDDVVRLVRLQRYQQQPRFAADRQPELPQPGGERVGTLVHLDREDVAPPGRRGPAL